MQYFNVFSELLWRVPDSLSHVPPTYNYIFKIYEFIEYYNIVYTDFY